jgi:hypothetical protein
MRPRGYPDAAHRAINLAVPDAATILQQPGQIGGVWSAFPAGGTAESLFGPSMPLIGAKARVIPPAIDCGSPPGLTLRYQMPLLSDVACRSRGPATSGHGYETH